MITYFTTAKDFIGKTRVAQLNAIRSWQHSVENAQIIIFGKSEGIEELAGQPGIFLHPEVKTSSQGTPHINDMFIKVQQSAEHDICCFINADIITTRAFAQTLISIHQMLEKNYLLAGQRYDISLDHLLDFDEGWEIRFRQLIAQKGKVHPPLGSDYFAFPRGQYQNMPDLLVGRGGWDLWMIYYGRVRNLKVIDISPTITVVHQNHNYAHRRNGFTSYDHDPEAQANLQHLPIGETYPYTLYACNYNYKKGKTHHNFARCNLRQFLSFELHLRKKQSPYKYMRIILKKLKIIR